MRKAKIFLVIRRLAGRSGGAERIYCELANMLSEAGHEVTCVHFEFGRGAPFYALNADVRLLNLWKRSAFGLGIPGYLRLFSVGYRNNQVWSRIAWWSKHSEFVRQLRRIFLRESPDLVIALMPNAITPSLLASLATGTRVVASNHNAPEHDYASTKKWDQNPLDKQMRLPLLRHAFRVHVLLESYGKWFPSDIQSKIEVIHNYPSDNIKSVPESHPRQNVVLAVGRLTPVKNLKVLIDAWAMVCSDFPSWQVHIYGEGPEEAELRSLIAKRKVSDSVHLMGQTTEIADVYASSSVLAQPSLYEGFPLSVVEALASGVPVIGFADTSGLNQLIQSGVNGLLVSREHDVANFSLALRDILGSPALLTSLNKNSPGSVKAFTKEKYLKHWLSIVEEAQEK